MSFSILHLTRKNIKDYLNELVQIDQACFGKDISWNKEKFSTDFPAKWKLSFMNLINEEIVGFAIASTYSNTNKAHLFRLAVKPTFQGKGIGKSMVRHLIELCQENDYSGLTVEIDRRFPVNDFYTQLGFQKLVADELIQYLKERGRLEQTDVYNGGNAEVFMLKIELGEISK